MTVKLAIGIAGLVGCAWLSAAVSVSAHHAFAAEFDANKPVEFSGTVTKMEWTNPHVWIHMDVKKPDGTTRSGRSRPGRRTCSFGEGSRRHR